MRALFPSLSSQSGLGRLLAWTVGACIGIFLCLQLWRPCYFLTDDNLASNFPIYTEIGRSLKAGASPFQSEYLFGGGYNYLRDIGASQWHPFILLPALLADTFARFWIVDIPALLFLILATMGFTVLAWSLREELSLKIPDAYIVFYTVSFVFSTYVLTVGASWLNFLCNQSALPWLALGILDRKFVRGMLLVLVFTLHELLVGYGPLTFSGGLCLTLFAIGVARWRRSSRPLLGWCAGNLLALLLLSPLLRSNLDGFFHSSRSLGVPLSELSRRSIPADVFPFSFFVGNWSEPFAAWQGDPSWATLSFPFVPAYLACAAAWCLIPALVIPAPWRPLDKLCALLAGVLIVFISRPEWLAVALYELPLFNSMRWPFREGMQFLFFVHLLLIVRFPDRIPRWQPAVALLSLMIFILPLPFIKPPTFNPLALDRQLLFSGQADSFWSSVKSQLKPGDEIVTAIDWNFWQENDKAIPYTLLNTANFPAYFQVRSISGYSPTAPGDQVPLKTIPEFWFGAFTEGQVRRVLTELPELKVLRIKGVHPLKITLSTGNGPEVDLSRYLPSPVVINPTTVPVSPSGP